MLIVLFGGGSYSNALLKFPKTRVIAIDRDIQSTFIARQLEKNLKRFKFYQLKFSQINSIIKNYADTVIFDLGLSSIQLNNLSRGFSFRSKDKLDMTMGLTNISAQEVVNNLSESN